MTTTFFLVRHAAHDSADRLVGRMEGIRLGATGRAQAERLSERMRRETIEAVLTSPRERTRETAEAIVAACRLAAAEPCSQLDEIDFGEWSGKTFAELEADPDWRHWNAVRSHARTPGGESMLDVQRRVLACMKRLAHGHERKAFALVSHADVIKAVVCHVLGMPIDGWSRFEIDPASITTVVAGDWGAKLLRLNETPA